MDETEYLLSSEANRKHLEKAMKSKEFVKFDLSDLKKHSSNLVAKKKQIISKK